MVKQPPPLDFDRSALFLDIDGTMLEIAPTPQQVEMPDGLIMTLVQLREALGGALAIVSGRSVPSIDALFGVKEFTAVGCHGAEIRTPQRDLVESSSVPTWAVEQALAIGEAFPGVLVEDKTYALSIHYRNAPTHGTAIVTRVEGWRDRLAADGFAILPGKAVVDIKSAAISKGTAVRQLMASAPFAGRTPFFAGDDVTDQEVLSILPEFSGVGISVGRKLLGAEYVFENPGVTRAWLAQQLAIAPTSP